MRVVAAVFLAAIAARAAEPEAHWISLRAGDMEIYSDASRETTIDIAENLERMRAALSQVSRLNVTSPIPTRVFIFRSEEELRPFARAVFGTDVAKSGAFVAHPEGNYILIDASSRDAAQRLAFHELVHFFVRNTWESIPLCFNEGLADLYSTFATYHHEVFFATPMPMYLRRIRRQQLLPLADLMRVGEDSPHYIGRVDQARFYAESWALVHYIVVTKKDGWNELVRFLALIHQGTPLADAFPSAFGMTYAAMERELQLYVRRPMLQSLRYVVDEFQTRALSAPRSVAADEVSAALGDLMMHTPHGTQSAREYFTTALSQNENNAPAKASLARYLEADGNVADAARLMLEAGNQPLSAEDANFWPSLREARKAAEKKRAIDDARQRRAARDAEALALQKKHDDEVERYNRAVEQARTSQLTAALTTLSDLLAIAEDETVLSAAKDLKDEIEKALKKP